MIYLLDSNVWITVLRQPTSSLAARFHAVVPDDVRVCSVVVAVPLAVKWSRNSFLPSRGPGA